MLTAKDTIDSKVEFLRNGADDYITKPFDIQEALARVEVQLRRNNEKYEVQKLSGNGMMLDKDSYRITIDDRELETITKQEFAILELLLRYPKKGRFVKKKFLSMRGKSRIWVRRRRWMFMSVISAKRSKKCQNGSI